MYIFDLLHWILNTILSYIRLAQNGEIGWLTVNRKDGKYMREQQPIQKKLKLIFLFNPLTEWIDTTHLMRLYLHNSALEKGREERQKLSRKQIQGFIDAYGIDMRDFEPADPSAYATFEDFFTRAHAPGARPIASPGDARKAVCVADARVVVYESVAESKRLWIKGRDFSITNLVMDSQLGPRFADGGVASFRLSPQDYHRYHAPVRGTVRQFRSMPGDYYEVDPWALQSGVDILTRNARDYVLIETEEFGDVLFVAIGASNVGTVKINPQWQEPGARIEKGDELGRFEFGGSSIIVAFEPGRIKFDDDLLGLSKQQIMVDVEVGMSLGVATKA